MMQIITLAVIAAVLVAMVVTGNKEKFGEVGRDQDAMEPAEA